MDQRWLNGSNAALDRFQYGYDADGNALYRDNRVNPFFGELYHVDGSTNGYDGLNQLQQFARGTLSADKGSITGTHYGTRVYAADAAGNFTSETVSGVLTSRTHNAQNELTALGGSGLGFDNAGNETSDGAGDSFSYDAWNRLVSSSKTGLTESYAYDALGRRTTETVGGTTRQLYYNDRWQVIEEEATAGGAAVTQYVWSALGSDHLVLRDRAPSGSGPLSEHFYVQQDANGDVTALVNTAGGVSERYVYDPYGGTGYLNASWGVISASTVGWQVLFQGERIDRFSLTDDRERVYAAGFERYMQNDPIGFAALDPNTYRFVGDNPVNYADPSGLEPKRVIEVLTDRQAKNFLRAYLGRDPTPDELGMFNNGCKGLAKIGLGSPGATPAYAHLLPGVQAYEFDKFPTEQQVLSLKDRISCPAGQVPRIFAVQFHKYLSDREINENGFGRPKDLGNGLRQIDPQTISVRAEDTPDGAVNFDYTLLHETDAGRFWEHMNRGRVLVRPDQRVVVKHGSLSEVEGQHGMGRAFSRTVFCVVCGPPSMWNKEKLRKL